MEVLFKILFFLCLSSATISLQLLPSLGVKSPIDLDFSIDEMIQNTQNKINIKNNEQPSPLKKCFCNTPNGNSQPVLNNLNAPNSKIQRIVVVLYKTNGGVKMYVPNKNKQELIPEFNFDQDEGDILKGISTESIVDIFDSNIVKPQVSHKKKVKQTESPNVVPVDNNVITPDDNIVTPENNVVMPENNIVSPDNNVEQPNGSHELDNGNNEYKPIETSDNPLLVEDNSVNGEPIPVDNVPSNPSIEQEDAEINPSSESTTVSQLKPHEISDQVTVIGDQDLGIITNLEDSDQQQQISAVSNINVLGDKDKFNNINWDKITNLDDFYQVLQILPRQNYQPPPNVLLQQIKYTPDLMISPYITFYEWFEVQLKRVMLYNLETQSKIIELRNRIEKILQDNGMTISLKGIVTDANNKLVRMNHIKLRPVLIGTPIDPQILFGQTKLADTGVLYIQLIEVIIVSPPKLLGQIILGTVYLPRSVIRRPTVGLLVRNKTENIDSKLGCVSCKLNKPQNPYSRPSYPHILHYPTVYKPYTTYNPYYGVPYRPHVLTSGLPHVGRNTAKVDLDRNDVSKSRTGILDELLGSLAPILFTPERRLLGGRLPEGPKTIPYPYPNDVQPGFRIIGGNPATSSGTPLVNKGRSGFGKRSYFI